jgi:thiosulfate/3-mercaptopyruvate sulfurtransferase
MKSNVQTESLVGTDWVARHLSDENVRFLEVDVDTTAYKYGHIPGAIGINWTTDLCGASENRLPDPDSFMRLCGSRGLSNNTTLVFYGDHHNWFAAYAYWLFHYYGHDPHKLKLMNGGRSKWIAEGRALSTDIPQPSPTEYHIATPNHAIYTRYDDLIDRVPSDQITLLDVRTPAEYRGEITAPPGIPENARHAGHIPGAINVPWIETVHEDGTFKSIPELRSLYEQNGVRNDQPIVVYCRIGERAAHTWFVLHHLLGLKEVSNYTGSWREWGNQANAPVA